MDSNEVRNLLVDIGKQLNRTENDMNGIIKRLVEDNWLDSIESLQNLTDAQWQQLQLPLRLMQAIRCRLHQLKEDSKVSTACTEDASPAENAKATTLQNIVEEKISEEAVVATSNKPADVVEDVVDSTVEYEGVDEAFPLSIFVACEELTNKIDVECLEETVKTLLKIIDGVLQTPNDMKRRRLKKSNRRFNAAVNKHRAAVDVLLACGFEETDEEVVLPTAYIARLTDCHYLLCDTLVKHNVEPPELPRSSAFNPYQTHYAFASSLSKDVHTMLTNETTKGDAVQAAIRDRKYHLMTGGGIKEVDLDPHIYPLDQLNDREKVAHGLSESTDDTRSDLCASNGMSEIAAIKEAMGDGPQFKSRARKELEILKKQKVYTKATLRVIFPDKFVLQMNFKPADTIAKVYNEVEKFLNSEVRVKKWYLYESPPMRKFTRMKTLFEERLVPSGLLRFTIEGKEKLPSYLDFSTPHK